MIEDITVSRYISQTLRSQFVFFQLSQEQVSTKARREEHLACNR